MRRRIRFTSFQTSTPARPSGGRAGAVTAPPDPTRATTASPAGDVGPNWVNDSLPPPDGAPLSVSSVDGSRR